MTISWKTVALVLAAITVHDTLANLHNARAIWNLREKNALLFEEALRLVELSNFYADKLNKNRVPIDEFDQIIMKNLAPKN